MNYIGLEELIEDLDLEIINKSSNIADIKIKRKEVNRPGLQLAGYLDDFPYGRIQVVGNVESRYLEKLDEDLRYKRMEEILKYPIPTLIVARSLPVSEKIVNLARFYDRTILRSEKSTTKIVNKVLNYLDYELAPKVTLHGVMIEVYGVGVLLIGKSGVGKSETALELIKRGHRLIADDSVELKRLDNKLKGQASNLIRHFMEIRGIGILDIERLYGVGAVKQSETLDLVIELEYWDEEKTYDRTGLDEEYMDILGVKIERVLLPIQPGRNIAMIVEVAARNNRQKKLGYNAAKTLDERIQNEIKKRQEKSRNNP